ncbi:tripartite tricarboxylate transporter substrate binding protein [Pigmentiphaga soli]|uniref:Tripartite tricarboxylate transporter substrate binding protein n=1 Tax=Pigmentiphaga soli TaxID=1007095 RepID=A0ABP8GM18_9BURK
MKLCRLLALMSLAAGSALAQTGDDKTPIKIVVPYAAGGPSDVVTRVVARQMGVSMGRPVVVDNKPGANGLIGMEQVARAAGDGRTLVMFSMGGSVINAAMRKSMPFDLKRDFTAVGNMVNMPQLFVVNPQVPARTVQEFIRYAKTASQPPTFGSSGIGGSPHLLGELFQQKHGITMTHVPYLGTGPATAALVAGQIQCMFTEVPVLIQHVKAGKLRALAIGSEARDPLLPDVPTAREAGLGFAATNWFGLQVPASTPPAIVAELNRHLVAALNDPATRKSLEEMGATPDPAPAAAFNKLVSDDLEKWTAVVKNAGITVD